MKRAVILAAIVAAIATPAASADNWPHSTFDQVASNVAGKSVGVWCENEWADWIYTGANVFNQNWSYVNGFTFATGNTVYLSPRQCETLHALIDGGPEITGQYYAASAVLTLVHEAMHQRGIRNEAEADCAALGVIKTVATSYFRYSETETEYYLATVTKKVKVGKKVIRVTTQAVRSREIPNTTLATFYNMAVAWHRAKPAEYQGNC